MSNGIKMIMNKDGTFKEYDDTYDIVIHCESKEEHDRIIQKFNSMSWIPADQPPKSEEYVLLSFEISQSHSWECIVKIVMAERIMSVTMKRAVLAIMSLLMPGCLSQHPTAQTSAMVASEQRTTIVANVNTEVAAVNKSGCKDPVAERAISHETKRERLRKKYKVKEGDVIKMFLPV